MPTIQISKIQMRRGPAADLPNPSLDDGEFGFADDVGRLFIGQSSPTNGQPNYDRMTFPYQNIEVLTETSPLGTLLAPIISDNQDGFITALPLTITGSPLPLQVYDSTDTATNFIVNLTPGGGANAVVYYYVFDPENNPMRLGKLTIVWNTNMSGSPVCTDESEIAVGDPTDISWSATLTGSMGNQYVVIQYTNASDVTPTVFFRIDRPLLS